MVVGEFAQETDLLVIGGGPGGYTAAFRAAARGVQTTLVDSSSQLGGVCLHRGCIPSKTLLGVGEMLSVPARAKAMGVSFSEPKVDLAQVNAWKDDVVGKLAKGLASVAKKLKVDVIEGTAHFEDGRNVAVLSNGDGSGGGGGGVTRLRFKRVIIAAGSRPVHLRGIQIDSPRVVDSTGALRMERIPKNALVIGGGYIGLELGSVLASLGTKVTVVEMLDVLIPGCDADLGRPLLRHLKSAFEEICTGTRVTGMTEKKTGIEVAFDGKSPPKRHLFDQVLVAVGRRPNSDTLDLEKAGIELTDGGFIKVDAQMRTSNARVFAIGDIVGNPMLAHKAMAEAKVAADVVAGGDSVYDVRCMPAVVFTDPELAWVGLTENEAKAAGTPVAVKKMPWGASGRATAMGRVDGLTKIVFDPETQRVLGVGLVGAHVGEMISEGALAIEMGAVAADLALTVRPHPTVSELLGEVADLLATPGGVASH